MHIFEKTATTNELFTAHGLAQDIAADALLVRQYKPVITSHAYSNLLLGRVMRLLVGMGLYDEHEQGSYMATSLAANFVQTSPLSLIVQQV